MPGFRFVLAFAASAAQPFADCELQFASSPGYDSAYCFYRVALAERLWDEGARRLDALREDNPDNHWLTLARGNIEWTRDADRAVSFYRTAADGFARQDEPKGEVLSRYNLRTLLYARGQIEDAARQVERAVEVAESGAPPEVIARAFIMKGLHLTDVAEELGQAYRYLRRAEAAAFPDGPYSLRRGALVGLANVCFRMGRLSEALDYYRRVEHMARDAGDGLAQASMRYAIVNTLIEQMEEFPRPSEREEILRLAEDALDMAADNREAQAMLHRVIGDLQSSLSRGSEEARESYERCIEVARDTEQPRQLGHCLWSLGRFLATTAPSEAEKRINEALSLADEIGHAWSLAYASRQRMRISWVTETPADAVPLSLEALDAIEVLRERQGESEESARVFSAWTSDYDWLAGRLLNAYREGSVEKGLETAFSLMERRRGRLLLDRLSAADARPREAAFVERDLADLEDVEASLGENEALLSFQLALWEDFYGDFGGGSWLLLSTRQGTKVLPLADRVTLEPAVPVFLGLFERRDGSEIVPSVHLYDELLGEAIDQLPPETERLILVPDGVLHHLPWGALRPDPDGEPLASRFELTVVPSATLWRRWRESPKGSAEIPALVLADPTLASSPGPLPYARREARSVMRRLGGASRSLLGEEASERFIKRADLEEFRILHLAAHAVVDGERPERTSVLLAPGADHEDGRLQIREIVDLNMEGRVVALSACRTASGEVLRGEGVMGLARAFFQAGAHTVVGSLWPLRDDDAASMFDAFYRHIGDGAGVGEAMREAQRDAIRKGLPAAAWAGLVVLGDGDLTPVPGGQPSRRRWLVIVAGLVGGLLVWGILSSRKARKLGSPS